MKIPSSPSLTIGIDLGSRSHAICVIDANSEVIDQRSIGSDRLALGTLSKKYPSALIVMEVGMVSPWTSRFFQQHGHRVIVANPRKVRLIAENDRKSDRKDAEMLARLARADERLLYPVEHGSEQAQRDLLQVKLRDNLVRQRVDVISSVRFMLKSLGVATRSPKTTSFVRYLREDLIGKHNDLLSMVNPSLLVIEALNDQIKALDLEIKKMCEEVYTDTEWLRQIPGVGPITALSFVLTVEDPLRFEKPRDVGAYLGLVPKRRQSGDSDAQLRISKSGDKYLRKLLVSAAQYVLGPFGPDCDLRRKGEELSERGGARAKKKAVVATARKLAVLLLTLWKNECIYEPIREAA